MKKTFIALLLILPVASQAQSYQGMSEADRQNMMEKMEQVQNCMAKVDRSQLMELEHRSRALKAEIDSLCATGKRDEAQKKAVSFGKEVASSNTMKTLNECSALTGQAPKLSFRGLDQDSSSRHICDF